MAEESLDQAVDLLERLARGGGGGRPVRARSSRSGSCRRWRTRQRGDLPAALESLEAALRLAEPEGYVRTFVDEGAPMAALLAAAADRGFASRVRRTAARRLPHDDAGPSAAPDLVEPLSEREQEVLRLLGTELSGPEIARELVVSLNTVRSHTKSIYTKLGVNTRRTAVRRAQELGLLSR